MPDWKIFQRTTTQTETDISVGRSGQRETNPIVITRETLRGNVYWDRQRKGYYWK